MFPYLPHTEEDIAAMLSAAGAGSLEELFEDIPPAVRLERPLDLPDGKAEHEVWMELDALSRRNAAGRTSYLGGGIYDHLIPAVVQHLVSRSEFYTAYTPYQPEMSQGVLQGIFEFQTMIAELTGLEVSNASLYDGSTAASEAAALALNTVRGARTILVSKTVHPFTRRVLATRFASTGVRLEEVGEQDGVTSREGLAARLAGGTGDGSAGAPGSGPAAGSDAARSADGGAVAALLVQSPNVYGCLEDFTGFADLLHARGALFIISANPLSLGVLRPPASWGADVAVGDTQPLGLAPSFGGPTAGYIAARKELLHRMPGRIVGQSRDLEGRRAFLLTLQAREQHIKRQRATSNICTNQALAALATTIHLAAVGRGGLQEAGRQNIRKAHYLFDRLTGELGLRPLFRRPFFNEFTLRFDRPVAPILKKMEERGILAGVPLERLFQGQPEAERLSSALAVAVTEKRSREELDLYVESLKEVLR